MKQSRLARLPEVQSLTGLGRSSVYARIDDGLLTCPVPLGGASVAWPLLEIEAINAARIAGWTNDQVRALVVKLETERTGKPATPRRRKAKPEARAA